MNSAAKLMILLDLESAATMQSSSESDGDDDVDFSKKNFGMLQCVLWE